MKLVLIVRDMAVNRKRITLKRKRPNPLFQEWLQELYDEVTLNMERPTKIRKHSLEEAIGSLSKYPLPLQTGAECAVLKGFNTKLCEFINKRLQECSSPFKFNSNSSKDTNLITPDPVIVEVNSCKKVKNGTTSSKDDFETNSEEATFEGSKVSSDVPCETYDLFDHEIQEIQEVPEVDSTTNVGTEIPENDSSNSIETNYISQSSLLEKQPSNRKGKLEYKPMYGSGSYAIVMGLWEHANINSEQGISKMDLLELTNKYFENSMKNVTDALHSCLWANMNKLVSKGLVSKMFGAIPKFKLTELGNKIAKVLSKEYKYRQKWKFKYSKQLEEENEVKSNVTIDSRNDIESCNTEEEIVELEPGSFDIILLIDVKETIGLSNTEDPLVKLFSKYSNFKHEFKCLSVGDFVWIARHRKSNEELVLPYIVERKRMDDLAASIKDGRYHEQKFRLKKFNGTVIYMVEEYKAKYLGLPYQTLMQSMMNTRIQDGFQVQITESLEESVKFLAVITMKVISMYKDTSIKGHHNYAEGETLMTYTFFNKNLVKNKALTVKSTFITLLLQLKGLSVNKAVAITDKYATPKLLMDAYDNCDKNVGEFLLANLKCEKKRKVGPRISKIIYKLFTKRNLR